MDQKHKHVLQPGWLTLVGTPIGHLGDLSRRTTQALAEADLIAAEDTRRTQQLLHHLSLRKRLISYHHHNRRQREALLIEQLKLNKRVVLVCDAGMPGISDPGVDLVAACIREDIPVTAIPGPTALILALVLSGLASDRFVFEGFLPSSGRQRRERLQQLAQEPRTVICYESPHRLVKTLADLLDQGLGDRQLALAGELTKRFESVLRLTVEQAFQQLDQAAPRGEWVLVLEGLDAYSKRLDLPPLPPDQQETALLPAIDGLLDQGKPVKDIAAQLSQETGISRNILYQHVLRRIRQANDPSGPPRTDRRVGDRPGS